MRLILIITIFAFYPSCKYQKLPVDVLIISLEKTPCFGPCEAYKLEIFSSGLVKFNGISNHKMIGTYQAHMTQEEFSEIVNQFRISNFFDFKDQYTGKMKDLPTTYLYFKDQLKEKTIQDYYGAPIQVKELERVIENLVSSLQWKKTD